MYRDYELIKRFKTAFNTSYSIGFFEKNEVVYIDRGYFEQNQEVMMKQ